MGLTSFPNGIETPFVTGAMLGGSTGKVFFVNGGTVPAPLGVVGHDGAVDGTVLRPFKTIQKAIDMCVSGRGDTIVVTPGAIYDENLVVLKSNLTLRSSIPTRRVIVQPTLGYCIDVGKPKFSCYGFSFFALEANQYIAAAVQRGEEFIYSYCDFGGNGGGPGMVLYPAIATLPVNGDDYNTASNGIISNCWFRDCGSLGSQALIFMFNHTTGLAVTDVIVEKCVFYRNGQIDIGSYSDDGSHGPAAVQAQDCTIRDCQFLDADKVTYIDLSQGGQNRGIISNCYFANKTAPLAGTQLKLLNKFVATSIYDANGLVNTHTF